MPSEAVLIADTDPRIIDTLLRILSNHIPNVTVETCTSAEALCQKHRLWAYDTIALSPILFQAYGLLKRKTTTYLLVAPIVVIAGAQDRRSAQQVLQKEAFDLIAKPIIPADATKTVRLTLWYNQLVKLLASRDRAVAKFQEHMAAFPQDAHTESHMAIVCDIVDQTIQTLNTSMRLDMSNEQEGSFLEMLAAFEEDTRKNALDRLRSLCHEVPPH